MMNIRQATTKDAGHLVRIFELASHGLAQYFWSNNVTPDRDMHEVALDSMRNKLSGAASNEVLIAERNGEALGGVLTYDIGNEPEPISEDMNPVAVPLVKLENKALNTRYINAIAVFPEYQGQGVGSAILQKIEELAPNRDLSLIVEDKNYNARRLYEQHGFMAVASIAIVREGWKTDAEEFILMRKNSV